jgi:AraC family transcriptional regulator of adaptative response/methylated-DNA-[protein]-cysteine methyltransferase
MAVYNTTRIATSLGEMVAGATDRGVCLLAWVDGRHLDSHLASLSAVLGAPVADEGGAEGNPHLRNLRARLDQYFRGEVREFDIPLDPVGTPFQRRVWEGLRQIPYGTTTSYAAQAAALGRPTAVRAVAAANGKNKISIVIPCHRVVGSTGSLTGYAGGLLRKQALLDLEAGITTRQVRSGSKTRER